MSKTSVQTAREALDVCLQATDKRLTSTEVLLECPGDLFSRNRTDEQGDIR